MINILHVSTLKDEHKNVSGLLQVIKQLSVKRNNIKLHIVGDGNDRIILEKTTHDLGIENIVIFHGRVTDVELAKIYSTSNFFILNSNYENLPVVCLEALSSGIPVISTMCGGLEELIIPKVGILIPKNNNLSLLIATDWMCDHYTDFNPVELHNYAINKFSCDVVGKKYLKIYEHVNNKILNSDKFSKCKYNEGFFCIYKKHSINNGYAIECHCKNCKDFKER